MLNYLKLQNVGPAAEMELELGSRLNIMTGDNGLGKSFLLDVAWFVQTGCWPAEVNSGIIAGNSCYSL
jgi:recombinational DNA repair ATPase RecF